MSKKSVNLLILHGIISLLVIVAYINSLGNDFVSDDRLAILENPLIGKSTYVTQANQLFLFPFFQNSIFSLFGPTPVWFRIPNILAHLASSNLIFIIFSTLVTPFAAFIAAAIFAVHPILVEAVTWISGGAYSLYTALFLLSFYLYIRAKNYTVLYIPSIIVYILSLSVGLPAVILSGILIVYEHSFGSIRKYGKYLSPYVFFSIVYAVFALSGVDERMSAFKSEQDVSQQYYNPLLQIPIALASYIKLFLWPADLTFYHSEFNLGNGTYILSLFICILLFVASVVSYRKNKFIFFCLSIFFISLIPMLTPFGFQWVYAERYGYFATIGLSSAAGYMFWMLSKKYKVFTYAIISIIIVALTVRTIIRNTDWKNEDSLWTATVAKSPSYYGSHNNMGGVYVRQGKFQEAAQEFLKAIELNPRHADAYYNLGIILALNGNIEQAELYYKKAIELNPTFWKAQQNLAILYFDIGQMDNAEVYMKKAQENNPYSSVIQASLGIIHIRQKNTEQARIDFMKALELNPNEPLALQGLAEINTYTIE